MAKKQTNLFIGVFLIVFSTSILGATFFYLHYAGSSSSEDLIEESALPQPVDGKNLVENGELSGVSLKSLVKVAEAAYDEKDIRKTEGFLWVDRKSNKFIVTLGALNGLNPGSHLTVSNGKETVGTVRVDETFDVISYVHPMEQQIPFTEGDYYKVTVQAASQ